MNVYRDNNFEYTQVPYELRGRDVATIQEVALFHFEENTITAPNGCIAFQGKLHIPKGYAYPKIHDKQRYLHRVVLEMELGRPLLKGMQTLHGIGCYKNCVNPAHLREGTPQENNDQKIVEGHTEASLNPLQVHTIDFLYHVCRMQQKDILTLLKSIGINLTPTSISLAINRGGSFRSKPRNNYAYVKRYYGPRADHRAM